MIKNKLSGIATYPLDYTDYLRTVEDVLLSHIRNYKVRLIPLTIAGLKEFAAASGGDPREFLRQPDLPSWSRAQPRAGPSSARCCT